MIYRKKQYYGEEEEKISTDISYVDRSTTLTDFLESEEEKIEANRDAFPQATATGTTFNVQDSSNLPIKDFAMLGNATQQTTSISGGDEYDSPSPDHPQDIHVVTGDNTVNIVGKNLFDKDNYNIKSLNAGFSSGTHQYSSASNQKHIYIKCFPNTTYTITKPITDNAVLGIYETEDVPAVGVTYTVLYSSQSSTGIQSVTTSATAKYLDIRINTGAITTEALTDIVNGLQIEIGSTATTYEPYTEQTQLLSLGSIELAKIGDYQDRIYKQDGKWWLEKNIGKATYNGTEDWSKYDTNLYDLYTVEAPSNFKALTNYGTGMAAALSNLFINVEPVSGQMTDVLGFTVIYYSNTRKNQVRLFCTNNYITSVSALQQILESENLVVYCALKTPTTTEITDTTLIGQLENVLKMHTNKNTTNGFSIVASGNVEGELKIEYYQDIQTLINNLNNAILSLGNNV